MFLQVNAAAGQGIAAGRYWTSFTCANVPVVGASDVCDVAGELRLENCTQQDHGERGAKAAQFTFFVYDWRTRSHAQELGAVLRVTADAAERERRVWSTPFNHASTPITPG